MDALGVVAPEFVAMAHRIVWCTTATVAHRASRRSRVLHPLWEWDGTDLVGWVGTTATPTRRAPGRQPIRVVQLLDTVA